MENHYLLEIGTEELPVGFLETAPGEFTEKVKEALTSQRIEFQEIQTYYTPRRLALLISGLPAQQPSGQSKLKGPPTRVALDAQGNPTQAGLGFSRKSGIDFAQLTRETLDGEEYLVLNQVLEGRPTPAILEEILPEALLGLSGSHFMHWGTSTIKFSRPLRWILSLWNSQVLPVQIGTLTGSNLSYGHRILSPQPIEIQSAKDYVSTLQTQGQVWVEFDQRKALIWEQLQQTAQKLGGKVPQHEELLNTVTNLVENPSVIAGEFQPEFLAIPAEVLTTVMAAHQKYFPLESTQGETLLPYFLTVSNGSPTAKTIIQHGNERVLRARFEDAAFFFNEDRKVPLVSRLDALKGITFQKGLGTLFDKTERLSALSTQLAESLGYDADLLTQTKRAALLAKTDLVTGMVRELTELQGEMGRKYAVLEGESQDVAEALFEQYLPRFTGDQIAQSKTGIVLSLADKLDTMVAVFSQKNARHPSGSKDPLGLRRMALGMIQTILGNALSFNLSWALEKAYAGLGPLANADQETTLQLVRPFILQRFKGYLLEQSVRYDIIDAVLETQDPLQDLREVLQRVELLKQLSQNPEALKQIYEPANRIQRILGSAYRPEVTAAEIQPELFQDPTEGALWEGLKGIYQEDCSPLLTVLSQLFPAVENFFNQVLVNDPNERIKQNRYNLLSVLNRFYLRLANFSALVV